MQICEPLVCLHNGHTCGTDSSKKTSSQIGSVRGKYLMGKCTGVVADNIYHDYIKRLLFIMITLSGFHLTIFSNRHAVKQAISVETLIVYKIDQ